MFKPYKYIKEEPVKIEEGSEIVIRLPKPKLPTVKFRKWASVLLIAGGFLLLTDQIILPFLTTPPAQKPLLKPTTSTVVLGVDKNLRLPAGEAGPQESVKVEFEFSELAQPSEPRAVEPRTGDVPKAFYLTIPKLGIERGEVETNSQSPSPDERLGHYAGSALPGEVGNTFIYGHSVLPMFFSPEDYRTIFSTLDELKEGDEITVEFGGKYFKYVVEKSAVLNPEDVRPLEPIAPEFLRESYLTLMTCVPMGVGTDRLLIQAKLVL